MGDESRTQMRRRLRQQSPQERAAAVIDAYKIARRLNECEVEQIVYLVRMIGAERANQLADEALEIEANGGMLTHAGDRRRSTGGIFFELLSSGRVLRPWQHFVMKGAALSRSKPIVWRKKRVSSRIEGAGR